MAIGQHNSDFETSKSFRPGLRRKFQSPLKRMLLGWAVFLFSEVKDVSFTHNNSGCGAVVHVRNGRRGVRRALLAVVQHIRQKASVPVMLRS